MGDSKMIASAFFSQASVPGWIGGIVALTALILSWKNRRDSVADRRVAWEKEELRLNQELQDQKNLRTQLHQDWDHMRVRLNVRKNSEIARIDKEQDFRFGNEHQDHYNAQREAIRKQYDDEFEAITEQRDIKFREPDGSIKRIEEQIQLHLRSKPFVSRQPR